MARKNISSWTLLMSKLINDGSLSAVEVVEINRLHEFELQVTQKMERMKIKARIMQKLGRFISKEKPTGGQVIEYLGSMSIKEQ